MNRKLSALRSQFHEWEKLGRHIQPIHVEEAEPCTCLCCGTEYRGNFCPGCGQSRKTRRLTFSNAVEHITSIFTNADGRFVHTFTDLFTRPGYMIWDYLKGRRVEYFQPIQMLFFLATIYLFLSMLMHVDIQEEVVKSVMVTQDGDANLAVFMENMQNYAHQFLSNKAVAALLGISVLIWPIKAAFRKIGRCPQLNMTEFFYAMCYMECLSLICSIILLPFFWLFGKGVSDMLFPLDIALQVWCFHQLFQIGWKKTVWRLIIAYILFFLIIIVLFSTIGIIIGFYLTMGGNVSL